MKKLGIQTALLISLTLLTSGLLLGLGLFQTFQWKNYTVANDDLKLESSLNSLHQEIGNILKVRMGALELIAEQVREKSGNGSFKANEFYHLLSLYVRKFNMAGAGICDKDGNVLESYNTEPGVREKFLKQNLRDRGFIDLIKVEKDSVVMHVKRGRVNPNRIVIMATPIWDQNRKNIIAYTAASITAKELHSLAETIVKNRSELKFAVLDQRNVIITKSNEKLTSGPLQPLNLELFKADKTFRIHEGKDEEGVESRAAVTILHFHNARWTLVMYESLEYLNRQQSMAWRLTIFVIGIGLFFSFLLSLFISRLITRPILRLVNTMRQIEKGQFFETMEQPKGSNFREITVAWNALRSMTTKLWQRKEDLERLVDERTKELSETHKTLDEQRASAMEASRLASLGEMAGGMAHEINNPLSIILSSAEIQLKKIQRGDIDSRSLVNSLTRIQNTTMRIAKIVQGLRNFSREGASRSLESVQVASIIEDTLSLCREKFLHNGIELKISDIPENLTAVCSHVQISQVILNLLNNAFDAVNVSDKKLIMVDVNETRIDIEIRIINTGPDIPYEIRDRIFEPFFTTKDVGKGTGLGLSISKGIIEAHGGTLYLDEGAPLTSFVIRLPKKVSEI